MVLEHYLIVKEWVPNFDPSTDTTENVIVWVRFPCISAEYFDSDFLMRVGRKIGKPLYIDTSTSLVSRANYARLCVEVDISKPLLSKFTIKRAVRGIVYEGLHLICFCCGTYGHNAENCPKNHEQVDHDQQTMDTEGSNQKTAKNSNGNEATSSSKRNDTLKKNLSPFRPDILKDYGPWMIAMRKGKNLTNNVNRNNQQGRGYEKKTTFFEGKGKEIVGRANGSRFSYLQEDFSGEETWQRQNDTLDQVNQNEKAPPSQGKTTQKPTKGKRPTAQVSEKQIVGNNSHGVHKASPGTSSSKMSNHQTQAHQRKITN